MKVKVKHAFYHDGKRYEVGEIVNIPEKLVRALGDKIVEKLKKKVKKDVDNT